MKKNKILVIVPARGGSKRIPKKNIKKIGSKPMIAWPIKELLTIFRNDQILVSTDDLKIKNICEKLGLKVPFLRPKKLSGDKTGTIDVVNHALKWFEDNFFLVDYVLIVYPTAILLKKKDINLAINKINKYKKCQCVFSASTFSYPIQRSFYMDSKNNVRMFQPKYYKSRSQDLTEAFHDAGQFYLCRSSTIRNKKNLLNSHSKIITIPRHRSIDIDTAEDFEYAKKLIKNV
ncbi:pseudaminic acid cytidylyltransferase [Candidatus Pelagibacter bacterium]|nr:pseudaminic acid cytidylyltransferase [Candidatus Pelagibacter bacterium]MDA8841777.1 pseudaminic acid cytidylyltransferase [Candidatus Pelagibacter bacterium]